MEWNNVEDCLPNVGEMVILWVWAEKHGLDDEGNPISSDESGVHMGECRDLGDGPFLSCFSTPFADRESITHWMRLPLKPGDAPAPPDFYSWARIDLKIGDYRSRSNFAKQSFHPISGSLPALDFLLHQLKQSIILGCAANGVTFNFDDQGPTTQGAEG